MWDRRSHLLQPIYALTSDEVTPIAPDIEQKAFEDIKYIVASYTLLSYSDFNKRFDIHNNCSDYH